MVLIVGQECERCHKRVWQKDSIDSTDLVVTDGKMLFLGDIQKGESSRPSLSLKGYGPERDLHYCVSCLRIVVNEWLDAVDARGMSKGVAARTYDAP